MDSFILNLLLFVVCTLEKNSPHCVGSENTVLYNLLSRFFNFQRIAQFAAAHAGDFNGAFSDIKLKANYSLMSLRPPARDRFSVSIVYTMMKIFVMNLVLLLKDEPETTEFIRNALFLMWRTWKVMTLILS